ncbi:MAG TPA: pentapeptide repeat-containing protein, partial [Acidimicrobiales bacterium]|nr:pentapeptide repeat-containing protein [Acidimicrobiales bacterium]
MLRFEAFQGGYATNPTSSSLDFAGIDRVFADAQAHGVLVIPVLANEWGQCDDGQQKGLDWFGGGFAADSPPSLASAAGLPTPTLSYQSYVQAFVERYRSSPALAMYEPIGEPDASTCTGSATLDGCSAPWVCDEPAATAALRSFYDTIGADIETLDPAHLVEAGFGSNSACGLEGADLTTVAASSGIDVLSFHDYNGAVPLDTQPAGSSPADEISRAVDIGKPIIDAEVGIQASSTDASCVTPALRADELRHKEQAQFAAGVSGFLVWNEESAFSGTTCDETVAPTDPALAAAVTNPPAAPPSPASATDVANRTVAGLNFSGADLVGVNLAGYDLSHANFTGADLTSADLDGATVTGADFNGATLTSVHAASLVGSGTFPSGWSVVGGDLFGPAASLTGDDLTGFDLRGLSLTGADMDSAILNGADLTGVDLSGTSLNGMMGQGVIGNPQLSVGWAQLGGFLLGPGANLTNATLPGGTIANVNLYGANLSGADLSAAQLVHVASGSVVSYWPAQLPDGWTLVGGFLLGPSADLTDATLTGLDLDGVDLTQATLSGVNGRGLTGAPQLPASWVIRAGTLLGPGSDLVGANLSGSDLTGVDLSGANLTDVGLEGATVTGADLTGATLTGAVAQDLHGCPTLGTGWVCGGG